MSETNLKRVAVIIPLVFLVLMFGAIILGMGSHHNEGSVWMRGFMPFGGPMMMFMWLIPIVCCVLVVLGVFWLLQARGTGETRRTETPLEVLKIRYASGEITKAEFDQMKKDLEDSV